MATNTSITIQFVTPDDQLDDDGNVVQSISVELDADRNAGRSQFMWGDIAYFKTYRVPADLSIQLAESAGTLSTFIYAGTDNIENEQMVFSMSDNASPSKPIATGTFESEWFGRAPEPSVTVTENGGQVKLNRVSLGFLRASFNSNFDGHSITIGEQPFSPYPIIVYISTVD